MKRPPDQPSRALVEQAIDDLSAILRLRTYLAPPAWGELNLTIGQLQVLMKLRRFGPVPMHRIAEWAAGREPADVQRISTRLAARRGSRDVYCYFDNDQKVRAPYDAMRLMQRLAR